MDTRIKRLKWNTILALSYQVVLVVCSFVLPRCQLKFYGSEVNGLISSITQFLSFINICDMGISTVVASAYYKPLADNDTQQISRIFAYARKFFRVIGILLVAYIVGLLVIYPGVVAEKFDSVYTIALILAMCISHFAQYFIGIAYQILLNADQKSYVQLLINGSTLVGSTVICVVLMCAGCSVQVVKLVSSIIYLLRPVLMMRYVKKHYHIDYRVKASADVLPQKWSGVIQHIAYIIYENTDVAVLTLCSSLANVSIYSVYTLVTAGIRNVITASTSGFQALFGNMIAKQEKRILQQTYGKYEWFVHTITTLLFTITGLLIVPFVMLYTKGINDVQYGVPVFAVLITLSYAMNCIRNGMFVLIRSAGHYKQTQMASMVEAVLNLGLSVIMVFRFGLVGVAIGTLAATIFFIVYEVVYLSKNIVFRAIRETVKLFAVDIFSVCAMIAAAFWVKPADNTVIAWVLAAITVSILCLLCTLVIQVVFQKDKVAWIIDIIKSKLFKISPGGDCGMTNFQRNVLALIKNALTEDKQILEDGADWTGILKLAKSAGIVPLVCHGIHPQQVMDESVRKIFRQITYQSMIVDRNQSGALHKLETIFRENGIEYMLLKGASIKSLYPYTEMRSMGDLDVLIRLGQYDKIRKLLLQNEFDEGIETDHELIWYKKPYTQFELHKHLIPSYNDDYYAYFGNGWKLAEKTDQPGKYAMSVENALIYIFTHFAKHYRDGGIGIRHLVDLWVYRRAYPDLDQQYICRELDKLGLAAFYENVQKTLDACFENGEETEITNCIVNWVFGSKVYGEQEKQNAANALRVTKRSRSVERARIKSVWLQIFPVPKLMRKKYKILEKCPVLLPVMWVVRWFEAIFQKPKNISKQRKRLKAINRATVSQYQAELNFVGLDYNF